MPNLHRKGRLTAYALACGYVETRNEGSVRVRLWREHGVYHISAYDFDNGRRVYWQHATSLPIAQAIFFAPLKEPAT